MMCSIIKGAIISTLALDSLLLFVLYIHFYFLLPSLPIRPSLFLALFIFFIHFSIFFTTPSSLPSFYYLHFSIYLVHQSIHLLTCILTNSFFTFSRHSFLPCSCCSSFFSLVFDGYIFFLVQILINITVFIVSGFSFCLFICSVCFLFIYSCITRKYMFI